MALPALVLAWLLSLAPVIAPALGVDLELQHPVAFALLVWLALAGLPRGGRSRAGLADTGLSHPASGAARDRGARPLAAAALALAPLAAALAGEHGLARDAAARGAALGGAVAGGAWFGSTGFGELAPAALAGWLLVLLLAAGAARSAGGTRHGLAWLALVPGLPLAAAALGWASSNGRGSPPRWLDWLAEQSPLRWAHAWLVGEPSAVGAVGPLAVAALLWILARADAGASSSAGVTDERESPA